MDLLVQVLSLPAAYIFFGVAALPIMLFSKGESRLPNATSYRTLLGGTLLLAVASFLSALSELKASNEELLFFNAAVQLSILNFSTEDTRLMLFYFPGLIIVVVGLAIALPNIKHLADEVKRRAKAEEELTLMLSELQVLTHKAEEANTAKSNFLASMSHELRTPLNAIIGFAEMLVLPNLVKDKERQKEYHEIIAKSGKHLLSLINDILDLSKIEEGKFERSIDEWNVNNILREALETVHLPARDKDLTLLIVQDDILLITDGRLLKQILINVLSNAVKFSIDGGEIKVELKAQSNGLNIVIEDQGIGMTEEEVAKVTDPFFQVEEAYSRTTEGSGLGMALVKRFVEFLDGKLVISSVKGEGTIINIEMPNLSETE